MFGSFFDLYIKETTRESFTMSGEKNASTQSDTGAVDDNNNNNNTNNNNNNNQINSTVSDLMMDRCWIELGTEIPSVQACYDYVSTDPSCGAISSFVGITRHDYHGKIVRKLWYEAYEPMAKKLLYRLCFDSIQQLYPTIRKIAIVHRLGDCPVGQISVIICCSSPHRKESIQCCEYLINTLKATIPIWKLEMYKDDNNGNEQNCVWKENMEWREGKMERIMVKQQEKES